MAYTSIDAVVAHFPAFKRGGANQVPTDAQIQVWIENRAQVITGLALARGYNLESLATSNPAAAALVASMNEDGAAADLGDALAGQFSGGAGEWSVAANLRRSYEANLARLEAGAFDKLFLEGARTAGARPGLGGIAGQEAQRTDDRGIENVAFDKDQKF